MGPVEAFPPLPERTDRPVLVFGAGNTHVKLSFWEGERCVDFRRLATTDVETWLAAPRPDWPVVIVSVVPEVTRRVAEVWRVPVERILTHDTSGLLSQYRPPEAMGADRLANALALKARGMFPGIVVDCGTATTLTVVDATGAVVGGAIACGLETAAKALWQGTALLGEVPLVAPEGPWGASTVASLQHGLFEGHVGLVRHLVERAREPLGPETLVVFTGGWGEALASRIPGALSEPLFTLEGGAHFARSLAD
jgi:type III pantothenate kinase